MINDRPMSETTLSSPLLEASVVNPQAAKSKARPEATVLLTSLIDAFSILVIYLLINFSSGETLDSVVGMELPSANQSSEIVIDTVIKVVESEYFIGDEAVDVSEIPKRLIQIKEQLVSEESKKGMSLIIQADKNNSFDKLNHLILAGGQAGFSEIKFAVLAN
tara:strand:+ start:30099 stop:30587 length:489 start_codon:yes stop_codon:yes gene_type:complete